MDVSSVLTAGAPGSKFDEMKTLPASLLKLKINHQIPETFRCYGGKELALFMNCGKGLKMGRWTFNLGPANPETWIRRRHMQNSRFAVLQVLAWPALSVAPLGFIIQPIIRH